MGTRVRVCRGNPPWSPQPTRVPPRPSAGRVASPWPDKATPPDAKTHPGIRPSSPSPGPWGHPATSPLPGTDPPALWGDSERCPALQSPPESGPAPLGPKLNSPGHSSHRPGGTGAAAGLPLLISILFNYPLPQEGVGGEWGIAGITPPHRPRGTSLPLFLLFPFYS